MSLPAAGTQKTRAVKPLQKFEGHTKLVSGVIHLPGRQQIMTCSFDGSLRVWDLKSGEQVGNDWRDGESSVHAIALSPHGKNVVSGGEDRAVKLWDIYTGKVITKWTGHRETVRSVCWDRDGGQVVSGSEDGTARMWDAESKKAILTLRTGLSVVEAVIYSPDKTMVATSGRSTEKEFFKVWNTKAGKLVSNLNGHTATVNCLAWTADGRTLISGSMDSSVRTWNTTTWQQVALFADHTKSLVNDIATSLNGRILASAALSGETQLWNLENGRPIGPPLKHAKVSRMSFSEDGKLLATACWDHNAYISDVSAIIREAGLDDLLLNASTVKSLLHGDTTPRRGQRLENVNRVPLGFFDDSPRPPHSIGRRRSTLSPAHDMTPQRRPLDWARSYLSGMLRRQNDEGTQLRPRRPMVIDVPFTKGKRRNVSAAEIRLEREKARKKKASTGSSQPPQGSVTQQSGGMTQTLPSLPSHVTTPTPSNTPAAVATSAATVSASQSNTTQQSGGVTQTLPSPSLHAVTSTPSDTPTVVATSAATTSGSSQPPHNSTTQQSGGTPQVQLASQPHVAVSTPSTIPANSATSTNPPPDVTIRQAGCWTRFWLLICCAPAQYGGGHPI